MFTDAGQKQIVHCDKKDVMPESSNSHHTDIPAGSVYAACLPLAVTVTIACKNVPGLLELPWRQ